MLMHDNLTKLFCFLFLLFQFAVNIDAAATPTKKRASQSVIDEGRLLTNAARMAAGLGPLKPRSLLKVPSRRVTARSPTSSLLPTGGTIQVVKKSTGVPVGYISKNVGVLGYGITNKPSEMMSVTFTPVAPFNIAIVDAAYPYLGFAGDNLNNDDVHPLVATNPTTPGASPQNVGNTLPNTSSESSIWIYDMMTHELTAQWVNSNPALPKTHFWYYPLLNKIAIVRVPALQSLGYEVTLDLVTP